MTPLRILVVTGARVLDVDARPRRWARWCIARSFVAHGGSPAGLVVHGGARGPDTWADELAEYLLLPRVVFPLVAPGRPALWRGTRARAARDAERYAYDARDPLARNIAMARWGADRAAEGHHVEVLALTAPWSPTRGTRHAMARAEEFGLPVTHCDAPSDAWPEESPSEGDPTP